MISEKELEELADKYEKEFHAKYPHGMTVSDYCNSDVPSFCFMDGYRAAEERAKVLEDSIQGLYSAIMRMDGSLEKLKLRKDPVSCGIVMCCDGLKKYRGDK